jgi:FkbM family methyltransferase
MRLHDIGFLRRIILPLLSRFNLGDITIRHHYTGDPIRLHSFRHKGYWYHGRSREKKTMTIFRRLLRPGDSVIEVGGHIGYISLYFKSLVQSGEVYVFEPGANNLPYIRRNVGPRGIHLVEKAAGDRSGTAAFFLESLTGQNNSFVRGFNGLKDNASNAFVATPKVTEVMVEMVRLDDFMTAHSIRPALIKIDVEGFELCVLKGMKETISRHAPKIMVEVQADEEEVYSLLTCAGYRLFNCLLSVCSKPADLRGNVFALHSVLHKEILEELDIRP